MPGEVFAEAAKIVRDTLSDVLFVPELPARGTPAQMIGRTLGMVTELPIDLQPAGWRLASGSGIDHRRARSLLRRDLDELEELLLDHGGAIKQQVTGPLTLMATVEKPRGDKVLSDYGARRELSEALAQAIGDEISDLQQRFAGRQLYVQLDEPALPAVMAGQIPTASGYSRHRSIDRAEVSALLALSTETIRQAGAIPIVHSCAANLPIEVLKVAGFDAVALDIALAQDFDSLAEVFDGGMDLWLGSTDAKTCDQFMSRLGFDIAGVSDRIVVTPSCGLAGLSRNEAVAELQNAQTTAASWR